MPRTLVYDAFDIIEKQTQKSPVETFDLAIRNASPLLEVKPRRVGGATYQVPQEIKGDRRVAMAMRWIINAARARTGKPMAENLAAELLDASHGRGWHHQEARGNAQDGRGQQGLCALPVVVG